jgi:hypothetical protein
MTKVLTQQPHLELNGQMSQSSVQSSASSAASKSETDCPYIAGCPPTPDESAESSDEKSNNDRDRKPKMDDLILNGTRLDRSTSGNAEDKIPAAAPQLLLRAKSCPDLKYDDCREFDSFAGDWIDSKGQPVLISPWGVIRYPNNPKLRFEAIFMGPNHLSVTFDKDPKRRKFVGKLNHDCELLIWSNDTKWAKKGSKHDPRFHPADGKARDGDKHRRSSDKGSCLVM